MTEQVSHVEEVLAFVHDTKTWRDMDTDERLEWCRRVALVLDDATNERFGEWTQTAIAPVLGVSRQVVSERLSWSQGFAAGDHDRPTIGRKVHQRASDVRRFFADPAIVGERKAEAVAEALADDYVAEQVASLIGNNPALIARYEKARATIHSPKTGRIHEPADPDEWQEWTSAQQDEFDGKTVKAARHLLIANWLRRQGYVASGEAEMLLNIVRPPSDLDGELADLLAQEGRL